MCPRRNQEQAGASIDRTEGTLVCSHVFATTTLTDKQRAAILGGNAAHLFGMKEA
jgi:hypothetical protein